MRSIPREELSLDDLLLGRLSEQRLLFAFLHIRRGLREPGHRLLQRDLQRRFVLRAVQQLTNENSGRLP